MKSSICRIVALIVVMTVQFLTLSMVVASADSERETMQQTESTILDEVMDADSSNFLEKTASEEGLKLAIDSKKVMTSERIKLSFDSAQVKDYYYIADGVNVVEKATSPIQFEIAATDEFGSIDIYADYGDGEFVKSSVYTYKSGDMVYVSELSKDRAWYDCMKEKYDANLITKEEWEDAYSDLTRMLIKEDDADINGDELSEYNRASTATDSSTTTVTGRISWEINETGARLPMKATRIELRDKQAAGSRLIAEGYTNTNGIFTFTLDNSEWSSLESDGLDIFIRWYLESETFRVAQDWLVSSIPGTVDISNLTNYYYDSNIIENVMAGTITEIFRCVTYDESYSQTKATYVQQEMVVGQRFVNAMGMSTENFIHVVYPSGEGFNHENAFCWGELANHCFSVIGTENFNRIDAILHEYGHFVEISKGNYPFSLWDVLLNDMDHNFEEDQIDKRDDKTFAMYFTWAEAWATAFSMIAQEYYESEYSSLPYWGDVVFNDWGYDLETEIADKNSCEAQEKAVTMFLWDLFDSEETVADSTESFDNIAFGYQLWWYATTRTGTYDLTDFVNVIETYPSDYRIGVSEIMAKYQISPAYFYVRNASSVSTTTPPQLSWRVNGSTKNPNDRFQVVFYNDYGQIIHACSPITVSQAYNTTCTYDVLMSDWNKVLKNYGGTFTIKVAVRGYHTEEPISGPYTSNFDSITLTMNKSLSIPANNRYTESVVKLDKGGCCEYTVTFATSGYKLIQTFGTSATTVELYSSSGTLLKSDDSSGYNYNSLIKYYCSAGTYLIKVKYKSTATYGETKLTITPANGVNRSASGDIGTYESILEVSNQASYSLASTAEKNYTKVITYRTLSAGSYTFTIESDFDTYIYVIDPRSTEIIASGVNYDDDSGTDLNPSLTTTLDARISYLVIFSAYNPNSLTSAKNLTVKINKN